MQAYRMCSTSSMKWQTVVHFGPSSEGLSSKPHKLAPSALQSCRCLHIGARSMPSTCCCHQSACTQAPSDLNSHTLFSKHPKMNARSRRERVRVLVPKSLQYHQCSIEIRHVRLSLRKCMLSGCEFVITNTDCAVLCELDPVH